MKHHIYYMQKALKLAHTAAMHDEVPVGALIVDQTGAIIATGYNKVEKKKQQIAHAEIEAITKACKKIGDWRLDGCFLYVTLQPCTMCMGLVQLSRIKGVIYGASSKLFGYQLDNEGELQLYNKSTEIVSSVLADEAVNVLQQFFKQKRIKSDRKNKKDRS